VHEYGERLCGESLRVDADGCLQQVGQPQAQTGRLALQRRRRLGQHALQQRRAVAGRATVAALVRALLQQALQRSSGAGGNGVGQQRRAGRVQLMAVGRQRQQSRGRHRAG